MAQPTHSVVAGMVLKDVERKGERESGGGGGEGGAAFGNAQNCILALSLSLSSLPLSVL